MAVEILFFQRVKYHTALPTRTNTPRAISDGVIRGKIEAMTSRTITATIPRTTARSIMFTPPWRAQQCTHLDRTDVMAVTDGGDGLHAREASGLRPDDLMA